MPASLRAIMCQADGYMNGIFASIQYCKFFLLQKNICHRVRAKIALDLEILLGYYVN